MATFTKSNKILKGKAIALRHEARQHFQTYQIHLPGKKKYCGKGIDLSTESNLVLSQRFGRQENYNSRNEHFKFVFAKNENGCTYVTFVDSNSTKMRISPIKLQGRMSFQEWWLVAEKNVSS